MGCDNTRIEGCDDPLILPTGPIGDVGPDGEMGPTPPRAATGPNGDPGLSGKSKIDINFRVGDRDYRTITSPTDTNNKYTLLGTFIYPGNTLFGGDPSELRFLAEVTGVTLGSSLAQGYSTTKIALVNLSSHPISTTTNTMVSTYAEVNGSITFYNNANIDENDTIVIKSMVNDIEALPDTECLIGIYAYLYPGGGSSVSVKFYSAELY